MSAGSKLTTALATIFLAVGLAACGSDDSTESTAGSAGAPRPTSTTSGQSGRGGGEASGKSDSAQARSGEKKSGEKSSRVKNLGNFVPKEHDDSGGGAEQFTTKGGDNSVQEFGEEAPDSEFEAVATALHNFLDARAIGDWTAACKYLSSSTIESFERLAERSDAPSECSQVLGSLTPQREVGPNTLLAKEARTADIGSARVEGDRAFVIYRIYEGTVIAISMAKEGDEWKVAALAGVPLN